MEIKLNNQDGQSGVSLVETLIVIVIIVVIASLAFMRMGTANTHFQRQNVTRELKVAFERARFDAVKRHGDGPTAAGTPMPAFVIVNANSYTLNTDTNRDGTYETITTDLSALNITISRFFGEGLPVTVNFDKRGEVSALDPEGSEIDTRFYICEGTCSVAPAPTSVEADLILVTRTGTVTLLNPDIGLPVFGNANVTNPTAYISNTVRLP
jgi:prepilin-type N-terminal cleavage/methylation domain-containing protein